MNLKKIILVNLVLMVIAGTCPAEPWGTAFTYQGYLTENGQPANGQFDLQFVLYSSPDTNAPVGEPLFLERVLITNGLFTVKLDFGTNLITTEKRWLGLSVEPAGGAGAFEVVHSLRAVLGPPMEITAYPLAAVARTVFESVTALPLAGATGRRATVAGGQDNRAGADYSTIGGGRSNIIVTNSDCSTIAGGCDNIIETNAPEATIGGGGHNRIQAGAGHSTIGGGYQNVVQTNALGATLSGGERNTIQTNAPYSTINGGRFNTVGPNAHASGISGGDSNTIEADANRASIGGGFQNVIGVSARGSRIGGGEWNRIEVNTWHGVISGGSNNLIYAGAVAGMIGGGSANLIDTGAASATISGGQSNRIESHAQNSAIGGGKDNLIQTWSEGATVNGGSENRISPYATYSTVSGGLSNTVDAYSSFAAIGGGATNYSFARFSTVGGGRLNSIQSNAISATISGGEQNTVTPDAYGAVIGGGQFNSARASGSTIAGGYSDTASADGSSIGGGADNEIRRGADGAVIGGGIYNVIDGRGVLGMIPGGEDNLVAGSCSLAAGRKARANHAGCFVWGDSSGGEASSTTSNQFTVHASGGARFLSSTDGTAGVVLPSGSGSWSSLSDRRAKTNCASVDGRAVLAKLLRVPIQTWNYRSQDAGIRHIGPMAQDFAAAFGVGEDDEHIAAVDADGVALAAIQGLGQKMNEQQAKLALREQEIKELKQAVLELKAQIGLRSDHGIK